MYFKNLEVLVKQKFPSETELRLLKESKPSLFKNVVLVYIRFTYLHNSCCVGMVCYVTNIVCLVIYHDFFHKEHSFMQQS